MASIAILTNAIICVPIMLDEQKNPPVNELTKMWSLPTINLGKL